MSTTPSLAGFLKSRSQLQLKLEKLESQSSGIRVEIRKSLRSSIRRLARRYFSEFQDLGLDGWDSYSELRRCFVDDFDQIISEIPAPKKAARKAA
jgi:hypothetical protein